MSGKTDILSFDIAALERMLAGMGEDPYRAGQLFGWLHQKRVTSFDGMTNLPEALRARLDASAEITVPAVLRKRESADGTVKWLLGFSDGNSVETVAMQYENGTSVCISTQVGCAMGCAFCASTAGGRVRDLTAGEMLSQVYTVSRQTGARAGSVVLMGIGEPLENFENTLRFYELITQGAGYGLSGRAVTVSTCGIVPRILELADRRLPLTLAVSLHATSDEQRMALMPVNRLYPLGELIPACRHYAKTTGRRVTFEYAVIAGINNLPRDADALKKLIGGFGAHVNLIPVNPVRGRRFAASREEARAFQRLLAERGINATVRRTLGEDIEAACGQLRRADGIGG